MKKIIQLFLVLTLSFTANAQINIDSVQVVQTCLNCDSIGVSPDSFGSLFISVSGGAFPYTFNLTGQHPVNMTPVFNVSNDTASFNQLCQDTFKLKITDNNGDSLIYNFTTIPPLPPTLTIDSVNVEPDDSDSPDSGVIELFVTTNADSVFYKIKEQNNSFSLGTLGGWQDSTLFDSLPGGYYYNLYIDIYPKVMGCGGVSQIDSSTVIYSIYVPLGCEDGFAFVDAPTEACVGDLVTIMGFGDPGSGVNNLIDFEILDMGDGVGYAPFGYADYAYSVPGDYWISYFIQTSHGCMFQADKMITIHPLPGTNFGTIDNGNGNYTFTDSSIDAISWVWDFGDGTTETMQNPTHQYSAEGTYTVCLTTSTIYGCDSTYCNNVDYFTVGVDKWIDSETLSVYPNPFIDQLTIRFKNANKRNIRILDVTGKILISQIMNTQNWSEDLSALPSGVYFLEVKNNSELKIIKLLKQ